MALASVAFTGNGTTGPYVIPFPYIAQAHVHVFVDGLEVGFSWLTSSTIQLNAAATIGTEGLIRRITPQDAPMVDWADGANINEANLDLQTLQLLYLIQETDESALQLELTDLNAAVSAAEAAAAAAQAASAIPNWFGYA